MTDAIPRCARCGRPIEVNRDLAAERFAGMHWLCFHLEVEHPGDPDAPCASPTCHVARPAIYAQALRDAGLDPHAILREAIARGPRRPPSDVAT
jgi:hypothetical protein